MSADTNVPDPEENADDIDGEEEPKKERSVKQLALFGGLGLLGLLIIGAGGAFMFGAFDALFGIQREKTSAELELGAPVTVELPQIKADLKTGRCRAPFMRATVAVILNSRFKDLLTEKNSEVMEGIILHLRDQERQDIVGKKGAEQLKFDLVRILNNVLSPARIETVIFKELLLQ